MKNVFLTKKSQIIYFPCLPDDASFFAPDVSGKL
nr:MAG TPA: hypothetical protein [Bacteriophage sp.]